MSNNNIQFIVRIRNPVKNHNKSSTQNLTSTKFRSPNRIILQNNIENYIGNDKSNFSLLDISPNEKYTLFTSTQQSNIIVASKIPVIGQSIQQMLPTKNHLGKFISMNDATSMEFDNVYNEQYKIDRLYNENLKASISSSMNRKNSCLLVYGPSNSGKSYLLSGNQEESGLLDKTIDDLLYLINTTNEINNVHMLKMSIYTIFNDNIFDLLSNNDKSLYAEENIEGCRIIDLSRLQVSNSSEYYNLLNISLKNLNNISSSYNVDLGKKGHIVYTFYVEKIIQNNIFKISQIDIVEMANTDIIFAESTNKREELTTKYISDTFRSVKNILVSISQDQTVTMDSLLTLCLKPTLNRNSETITFLTCVHSNEYPLSVSMFSLKYIYETFNQISNETDEQLNNSYITGKKNSQFNDKNHYRRESNSNSKEERSRNSIFPNKIQEINEKIHNLSLKSNDITSNKEVKIKNEVNDLKRASGNHENSILKADNIIYREEITKLSEINQHYENELHIQRNKTLELVAQNELLFLDKNYLLKENEKLRIELEKSKSYEISNDENYTIRYQNAIRLKELENENKTLLNERNKFEIDYKVINERYNELKLNYDKDVKELEFLKTRQNEELDSFDKKLSRTINDLDNLTRENKLVKMNEDKLKQDLNKSEKDKEIYKEKYREMKSKNSLMSSKIIEIESDLKTLMMDRESEFLVMKKTVENKKTNVDNTKHKLIEEMQKRLNNFKDQLHKKRFNNNSKDI